MAITSQFQAGLGAKNLGLGIYGTLGVASTNNIPGARQEAISWTDGSKLWLFGGQGIDSGGNGEFLNDLWVFDSGSGEWTWMGGSTAGNPGGTYGSLGVASASNVPGSRTLAVSWVDSGGHFWLFGGFGNDSAGSQGDLNDLWEWDPTSGQWTWESGSKIRNQKGQYGSLGVGSTSNTPGARQSFISWVDGNGKLWLFGGSGYDASGVQGYLNDLWEFDPTTGKWTWVSGSNAVNQKGTYGSLGVGSTSNIPGGRTGSISWVDSNGKFWLFGGEALDANGTFSYINDLWEYDPSTGKWTWFGGSNTIGQKGTYGSLGVGSTSNIPGSRTTSATWTDSTGKLWLFGGYGADSAGSIGQLNDLWEYDPTSGKWTWVGGSNVWGQNGSYGSLGAGSTSYIPGGRSTSISWLDASGKFWLFGGMGYDSTGSETYLNDLWKFDPTSGQWTWLGGTNTTQQKGAYGSLGVASTNNLPGARESSTTWSDGSGMVWLFGGLGTDSVGSRSELNDLWEFDPTSGKWAWMGGSNVVNQKGTYGSLGVGSTSNIPGARELSTGWVDSSGIFWLFGGYGRDSAGSQGPLNDLWKYDPTGGQWTWVGGSNVRGQKGTYGSLGVGSTSNIPGARSGSNGWIGSDGSLWLFGGSGYDSAGSVGSLNDWWKFDPTTGNWTWVGGSNTVNQMGSYGSQGTGSTNNIPGARYGFASWVDSGGKLWLFGGYGYDSTGSQGYLNDLWKFDPTTGNWAWVGGSSVVNQMGIYGSKGTGSTSNAPGARGYTASWVDSSGGFWLFGGTGLDASGNSGDLNDLWRFDSTSAQWSWVAGSNQANQVAGDSTFPGARSSPSHWTDKSGRLWLFGGDANAFYLGDLWYITP